MFLGLPSSVRACSVFALLRARVYTGRVDARLIDGKQAAHECTARLATRVQSLRAAVGTAPFLAAVLVGDDPASCTYVAAKQRALARAHLRGETHRLPAHASHAQVLELIARLNEDARVHGILIQLPLPAHLDAARVCRAVAPEKDVDGFHPLNCGALFLAQPGFVPCTPAGIVHLLRRAQVPLAGARVVIVGRSAIVGRPLAVLLASPGCDATVTLCHSHTRGLADICVQADILVAALGKARFIGAPFVRTGAVVIDVGIHHVPDATAPRGRRLCGDVDFDAVAHKVQAITPVPGGVGPMTIAMLLHNTLCAAEYAAGMIPPFRAALYADLDGRAAGDVPH